jgi:integrase/recombinase XerD
MRKPSPWENKPRRENLMSKDTQQSARHEPLLTDENAVTQSDLFSGTPLVVAEPPDQEEISDPLPLHVNPLTDRSSLASCALPYQHELELRGKSTYTVTCFLSDLRMFSEFAGRDTPVGRLTKEHLTDWLMKLKFGVPGHTPAPKTMARRVTFLKNFFSWLTSEAVINEDPSASLVLERPLPPLPELLFDNEVERLLEAAATEPRCHCLIYLVLYAGLKKEEVMGLKLEHIDLLNPREPRIRVHFAAEAGKQHRERTLALDKDFALILEKYRASYHPSNELFVCTDRNLNYILARAVKDAGIKKRVTLQLLRDTFAVQQLRSNVTLETLREKLGLSDEAWLESREKYRRLAFPNGY